MVKHKHAEVIHAWADGAKVQCKTLNDIWVDRDNPGWTLTAEYRIKPTEKVVRWLWLSEYNNSQFCDCIYMSENEARNRYLLKSMKYRKLEWSREEFDE